MMTQLFRQEALDHQRAPVRGSLLLAAAPRSTWLGLGAFAVAITLLAFAWLGEFNRKAHVQGYLSPNKGLIKVYPQLGGTLVDRPVDEGARVSEGEVLAVISTERGSLSVRAANGQTLGLLRERETSLQVELANRRRLDQLRAGRVADSLENLREERRALDAAIRTLERRLRAASEEAARFDKLESEGFVAATQLQRQQDRVLEQRGQLQSLMRDRVALQGRLEQVRSEQTTTRLEGEAAQAALERRINQVRQELTQTAANSDVVIRAPADGVVSAVLSSPGQQVRPETPLLSIIPAGAELEAKLLVPSHAIGFIAPSQAVALRFGAFPYQRFGHYRGSVSSIAKSLLLPGDARLPLPLDEPAYVVTVALESQSVRAYDRQFALQAGMALDADITLGRRSVIEWIFEPLFSLAKRT